MIEAHGRFSFPRGTSLIPVYKGKAPGFPPHHISYTNFTLPRKHRPGRVVGDKAYSSRHSRQYLRRRGIRITLPHKENGHRSSTFDRVIHRLRERVEQLINRLKQNRQITTRYEKCADNYRAMWLIAAALLWL
jgi:transposase